ncbi:hypothetical protein HanXRQr2_Chr10g0428701 [Helianthus annuus]|uniref:Uncharacterized protein n=1 Tax=Helianthus annuus TaxID=4232 RepID=A0A9K3HVX7_HELAN|nr:hypothetical protein HanXRQr2_Chr10g0428701 [Helianthus annuus]KAJ0512999.1 hypothetical protein HanHA300_Chr10g0352491 [Helianthus annuus]KAJ0529119.1 hypothetical protein HanHA89_Chr10g0374141 [Helianthus annuus]
MLHVIHPSNIFFCFFFECKNVLYKSLTRTLNINNLPYYPYIILYYTIHTKPLGGNSVSL